MSKLQDTLGKLYQEYYDLTQEEDEPGKGNLMDQVNDGVNGDERGGV